MSFRESALNALVAVTALSSVLTAAIVVRREVRPAPVSGQASAPREVNNWQRFIDADRQLGPADAPVTLVEFADFQCPACKQAFLLLDTLKKEFPGAFSVSYRHFPLAYHKRAYPAARASECAREQGKFAAYHDALYHNSDALDTLSFDRIAADVGVADLLAFRKCVNTTTPHPVIARDLVIGNDSLQVGGTPTFIMNGKVYSYLPPMDELRAVFGKAMKQKR